MRRVAEFYGADVFVTLNPRVPPAAEKTLRRLTLAHPLFNRKALEAQGLPKALRHEVRFPPVREGHRMVGSGMFVVNAPYGAADEAARLSRMFRAL